MKSWDRKQRLFATFDQIHVSAFRMISFKENQKDFVNAIPNTELGLSEECGSPGTCHRLIYSQGQQHKWLPKFTFLA